jgi:thiol-disulfide isomerase/thioredoxin
MKKGSILSLLLFCLVSLSAHSDWHVYVFIAEECPICNYMGKPLQQIAKKYEDKVAFHAVFPVRNSNYKTSQLFKEQYDLLNFETLLDKDQAISKKLGARVTPEVVITDADGEVRYRGRINSAYYAPGKMKHSSIKNDLDDALAQLISGKEIPQPWPSAVGCYITMNANK